MRGVNKCPRRHKTRGIQSLPPTLPNGVPPFGYKHSLVIQQQVKEVKSETPKHRNCSSRRTKRAMGDERAEQLKKMEKELREVRDPIRSSAETLKRKNELKRQLQESKGGSSKEL
ncbi:hypothetical protein E4U61_006038 [Claviceps capensis]|nr:hypothetical protein E4U61_006038 [Claviceps capensis]